MRITEALSPYSISTAFCVRYQVYSQELCYTQMNDSQTENDEYDTHSRHFLVYQDTVLIGCYRIVYPDLPCFNYLDYLYKGVGIDWKRSAEISRVCVLKQYRTPALASYIFNSALCEARRQRLYTTIVAKKPLIRLLFRFKLQPVQLSSFFSLNGTRAIYGSC